MEIMRVQEVTTLETDQLSVAQVMSRQQNQRTQTGRSETTNSSHPHITQEIAVSWTLGRSVAVLRAADLHHRRRNISMGESLRRRAAEDFVELIVFTKRLLDSKLSRELRGEFETEEGTDEAELQPLSMDARIPDSRCARRRELERCARTTRRAAEARRKVNTRGENDIGLPIVVGEGARVEQDHCDRKSG